MKFILSFILTVNSTTFNTSMPFESENDCNMVANQVEMVALANADSDPSKGINLTFEERCLPME